MQAAKANYLLLKNDQKGWIKSILIHKKKDKKGEDWTKHYALITCLERNSAPFKRHFDQIIEPAFNVLSFYDLLEDDTQTESDLFNEFWYRWGDPSF